MLAVFAWILSIVGIAVTFVYLLGAAMSTVPQKVTLLSAITLAILPLLVLAGAGWGFSKGSQIGKSFLRFGIPFLISIVTLVMIGSSVKLPRFGGPDTEYFGKDTEQPRYRLEIRAASLEPIEGYREMRTSPEDPVIVHVAEEALFTNADLHHTTTFRENRHFPTKITLGFHGRAQPRLQELSLEMKGAYWAILLDGDLWTISRLEEPLERELTLDAGMKAEEAGEWASGMVQE
ncbi:MAG: hypothetical protein AAGC68_02785 [Verrucomicrobiota bacterium]